MREFYVSRQSYSHESGAYAVEIARELDYSSPGALGTKYASAGEGSEYVDPRDAAKAAIAVREAWQTDMVKWRARHDRDGDNEPFDIALTLAMNDMIYPVTDDGMTPDELMAWAETRAESMPKCAYCGDLCEREYHDEWGELFDACSVHHAELYSEAEERARLEALALEPGHCGSDDIDSDGLCNVCGADTNPEAQLAAEQTPRYDDDSKEIVDMATCGTCGRTWNDAAVSSQSP